MRACRAFRVPRTGLINIRTAFKPCRSVKSLRNQKIGHRNCQMSRLPVYVHRRRWELKELTRSRTSSCSRFNGESAIKQHAQRTDHDIHPRDATFLEREITLKLFKETLFRVVALNDGPKPSEWKYSLSARLYSSVSRLKSLRVFQHVKCRLRFNKHHYFTRMKVERGHPKFSKQKTYRLDV